VGTIEGKGTKGGDDRARTGNLRVANAALSQLSYVPGLGALGFEPRTSALSGLRSNQLSYAPGARLPQPGCFFRQPGCHVSIFWRFAPGLSSVLRLSRLKGGNNPAQGIALGLGSQRTAEP
jgi:hypothetical protein